MVAFLAGAAAAVALVVLVPMQGEAAAWQCEAAAAGAGSRAPSSPAAATQSQDRIRRLWRTHAGPLGVPDLLKIRAGCAQSAGSFADAPPRVPPYVVGRRLGGECAGGSACVKILQQGASTAAPSAKRLLQPFYCLPARAAPSLPLQAPGTALQSPAAPPPRPTLCKPCKHCPVGFGAGPAQELHTRAAARRSEAGDGVLWERPKNGALRRQTTGRWGCSSGLQCPACPNWFAACDRQGRLSLPSLLPCMAAAVTNKAP